MFLLKNKKPKMFLQLWSFQRIVRMYFPVSKLVSKDTSRITLYVMHCCEILHVIRDSSVSSRSSVLSCILTEAVGRRRYFLRFDRTPACDGQTDRHRAASIG